MKSKNKGYICSILLIFVILIQDIGKVQAVGPPGNAEIVTFKPSSSIVDVYEEIQFDIEVQGWIDHIYINYGDGRGLTEITNEVNSQDPVTISYKIEGTYLVSLNVMGKGEDWEYTTIEVKNEPPVFDVAVSQELIVSDAEYTFSSLNDWTPSYHGPASQYSAIDIKTTDAPFSNALRIYDPRGYSYPKATNGFSSKETGSVEFWIKSALNDAHVDVNNEYYTWAEEPEILSGLVIELGDGIEILIDHKNNNKIRYRNGEGYKETDYLFLQECRWAHVRITFNCLTDTFKIFIDGILAGKDLSFTNDIPSIDSLSFRTTMDEKAIWYVDSVGYSWTPGYIIGDNFKYAQAITSTNEDSVVIAHVSNLEESIIDAGNLTYLWNMGGMDEQFEGDSRILWSWRDAADFPISLTILDPEGAMHTDISTIEVKNIVPQPKISYGADIESSYDFNNQITSRPPNGWVVSNSTKYVPEDWLEAPKNESVEIVNQAPEVVEWKEGHYKVVEFKDLSEVEKVGMLLEQEYLGSVGQTLATYGSWEQYFYTTDSESEFYLFAGQSKYDHDAEKLISDDIWKHDYSWDDILSEPIAENLWQKSKNFGLRVNNGEWEAFSSSSLHPYDKNFFPIVEFGSVLPNTWYHIKVEFNFDNILNRQYNNLDPRQFRIYLNGTSSGVYEANNLLQINHLGFMSGMNDEDYQCYIDALGVSWDPNYEIGQNFIPYTKTYAAPYDFRYVPSGQFPSEPWTLESIGSESSCQVVERVDPFTNDNHYKILEIKDNDDAVIEIKLEIEEKPEYGAVAFWFYTTDREAATYFSLGNYFKGVSIKALYGRWYYETSEGNWALIPGMPSYDTCTWYRLRVDFKCTDEGYELEEGQFLFFVDYYKSTPLELLNNEGYISSFSIKTDVYNSENSINYIDAVGFNWLPGYEVEYNREPRVAFYDKSNIYFSAEETIDSDSDQPSMLYFWEFGDGNIAYGKDVAHQFIESGRYSVSLISIDDNGEVGMVTEEIIVENRPPEIQLRPPLYRGTYNFESDLPGKVPTNWSNGIDLLAGWQSTNQTCQVVNKWEDHYKVLSLDPITTGYKSPGASFGNLTGEGTINFSDPTQFRYSNRTGAFMQKNGSVEFWIYLQNLEDGLYIQLMQSWFWIFFAMTDGITIKLKEGALYMSKTDWVTQITEDTLIEGLTPTNNAWNHFRIDFSCENSEYMNLGQDQFRIALNGEFSQNLDMPTVNWTYAINNNPFGGGLENHWPEIFPDRLNEINLFNIFLFENPVDSAAYVDAVGVSWDKNYNLGDNKYTVENYEVQNDIIYIEEGQTIVLNALDLGASGDYSKLRYYWGTSGQDPLEFEYQVGGWKHSYYFEDDNQIKHIKVYVEDSEGMWDSDSVEIRVINVDPTISIESVSYNNTATCTYQDLNITLEISGPTSKSATFYLDLIGDNTTENTFYLTKPSGQHRIKETTDIFSLDLSKDWQFLVNYTEISGPGVFWVYLTVNFQNGTCYALTHKFHIITKDDEWLIEPDEWWAPDTNYSQYSTSTFSGSIFDPGLDNITLDVNHVSETFLQLNFTNEIFNFTNLPSEYFFEGDEIGSIPEGWSSIGNPDSIRVEQGPLDGRSRYVNMSDATSLSTKMTQNFTAQKTGTINLWMRTNEMIESQDIFDSSAMIFFDFNIPLGEIPPLVFLQNNSWFMPSLDGTEMKLIKIADAEKDRWYNIQIDFEFQSTDYTGLNRGEFRVTIDKNQSAIVYTPIDYLGIKYFSSIAFATSRAGNNYSIFIDDIKYYVPYRYETYLDGSLCTIDIFEESETKYARVKIHQDIFSEFYTQDESPVNLDFNFTINPQNIDIFDAFNLINTQLNLTNLELLQLVEKLYYINVSASDEDGGRSSLHIDFNPETNQTHTNLAPKIDKWSIPGGAAEDVEVYLAIKVSDPEEDPLSVQWMLGDSMILHDSLYNENSSVYYIRHKYTQSGKYMITAVVNDGINIAKKGFIININNNVPFGHVYGVINATEGVKVDLRSEFSESPSDLNDFKFYWDFGDGTYSQERHPSKSWVEGEYNITLWIMDDSGITNRIIKTITIHNAPPVLEGPFSFTGADGRALVLDVSILDSYSDEVSLHVQWDIYDSSGTLIDSTHDRKPSFVLNEGTYSALLTVTDGEGLHTSANISIFIENVLPVVTISSKMYYGGAGEVELCAYAMDSSSDLNDLSYEWTIFYPNYTWTMLYPRVGQSHYITVDCTDTGLIKGHVKVIDDSGASFLSNFELNVYMDDDGDTLTMEWEGMHGIGGVDHDGDGLSNLYELEYTNTSIYLFDTDDDGLADGYDSTMGIGEVLLGTDPLSWDSDLDGLGDGFEWHGWDISVQRDAGEGFITIRTTPSPLLSDTDFDNVSDYWEYFNGTDPSSADTDFDGLSDWEEFQYGTDAKNYDTDGDFLTDAEELNGIYTEWGIVYPNATQQDSDGDGLTDYQEVHGINILRPTNPMANDSDNDFLLDSQELATLEKSYGERASIDKSEISEVEMVEGHTFEIDVLEVAKAYTATTTIAVSSSEYRYVGALSYSVKLNGIELFKGSSYGNPYFVNVTEIMPLVEEKNGGNFRGTYALTIYSDYNCLLEQFTVQLDTYLDPTDADTDDDLIVDGAEVNPELNNGWMTHPLLGDSDGDGWSDYKEIYEINCNPLSRDTDADGVSDPNDISPTQNLFVKVHIGEVGASANRIFNDFGIEVFRQTWLNREWVEEFDLMIAGLALSEEFDSQGAITPSQNTQQVIRDSGTGSGTSEYSITNFGANYYFDIDDDLREFSIDQLFLLGRVQDYEEYGYYGCPLEGDPDLLQFDFRSVGQSTGTRRFGKYYNGYWWYYVDFSISTVGINRVNTIAVYNESFSVEHGRYYAPERMAIVQIGIAGGDIPQSSPFEQGLNAIVVPTSIFGESKFNSIIQLATNETTGEVNWSMVPACLQGFEFSGQNRAENDYATSTSDDIELVMIHSDCTLEYAEEILELILTGVVNETQDELNSTIITEGLVANYTCTKLDGFIAELMNLPFDVLKVLPLDCRNYVNSPMGELPLLAETLPSKEKVIDLPEWLDFLEDFLNYFLEFARFMLEALNDLFKALASGDFDAVVEIFVGMVFKLIEFGFKLIEFVAVAILSLVGLLKYAVLILVFIMLALEVFTTVGIVLAVGSAFSAINMESGISTDYGINIVVPYAKDTKIAYMDMGMEDNIVTVEGWINWYYWAYMDLYIPIPSMDFNMDSDFTDPVDIPEPPSLHCGYSQVNETNSTHFNFFTTYIDGNGDRPEYVKLYLIAPNGTEIEFDMTNYTEIYDDFLVQIGVEYNITIDFVNMSSGQWFYYFTAKEDTPDGFIAKWPSDYYCEPGPFINNNGDQDKSYNYLLYSYIDTHLALTTENVTFSVVGADFLENKNPINTFLNILWDNGTIQPIPMEVTYSYTFETGENETLRNVTLATYEKTINFPNYIDIDEKYIIRYYISVQFADGIESALFDWDNGSKVWFDELTLLPYTPGQANPPQILGWKGDDVNSDTTISTRFIGPVYDTTTLRFWVFVSDPDGDHTHHALNEDFEFSPELILTNLDDPNAPLEPIKMAWAGKGFDPYPDIDAYFIDVLLSGAATYNYEDFVTVALKPGAWTFEYSIKDNTENTATEIATFDNSPYKIWHIGSASSIWNAMFYGSQASEETLDTIIPGGGTALSIAVPIGFTLAGLLSMIGSHGRMAARGISIGIAGYDLVNTFLGWSTLLGTDDTGALLGLGLNTIVSAAGVALAHSIGTFGGGKFLNINNLGIFAKIAGFTFLATLILSIYCNPTILLGGKIAGNTFIPGAGDSFDWDAPGEEFISQVPLGVMGFFISILSLGAILNIAEFKEKLGVGVLKETLVGFSVMNSVLKITKYYTYIKCAMAALFFMSFMAKTGLFHIAADYITI